MSSANEAELVEELAQHAEDEFRELVSRATPPDQAIAILLARLDGPELREVAEARARAGRRPMTSPGESPRRGWVMAFLEESLGDARFATRIFRKHWVSLAVAIGTLTIGMAVVTTMFAFFNAAVLAPPPFANWARLRAVSEDRGQQLGVFSTVSHATVEAVRHNTRSFARLAVSRQTPSVLSVGETAEPITVTEVDTALFGMLGVMPRKGRLPFASEIETRAPVIVISDRLARSISTDRDVVGRTVHLQSGFFTVIGVMPAHFSFPQFSDAWVPLDDGPRNESYNDAGSVSLLAELRPGVEPATAQRELDWLMVQLKRVNDRYYRSLSLHLRDEPTNRRTVMAWEPVLILFLGAAACVMLIGCVNVGNLLLMRAAERRPEYAVRMVLGADFRRLVRQTAMESAMVSAAAAIAGLIVSVWMVHSVDRIVPLGNIPWLNFNPDWRVFLVVVGIAVAAVFLTSGSAIRQLRQLDLNTIIKGGGGNATSASVTRMGERGVVAQVMLCSALTVVVSIFATAYRNSLNLPPEFDRAKLVEATIFLDSVQYPDSAARVAVDRAFSLHLQQSPAIEAEGRDAWFMGFRNAGSGTTGFDGEIYRADDAVHAVTTGLQPQVTVRVISDTYLRALARPLIAGRAFLPTDSTASPTVAVISERMAQVLFANEPAVGRRFRVGRGGLVVTVAGVVTDRQVQTRGRVGISTVGAPDIYFSERQAIGSTPTHWVRARGSLGAAQAAVVAQVRAVAPGLRYFRVAQAREQEGVVVLRIIATVLLLTGAAALGMAVLGIYAVTSYAVVQRTRTIGIQLALGASPERVYLETIKRGLWLVGVGLFLGLALGGLLELLVNPSFWGASPFSIPVYAGTIILFSIVGIAACHQAGRRGARVEPAVALKA